MKLIDKFMSCTQLKNEEGQTIGFACGSSWGIGVYETGIEEVGSIYGFPPRDLDPHDFCPDYECCSDEEIADWEKAKRECPNHKD